MFLNCENLTRIEIQDGVTTIGREAFYNCKNLKVIKIPGSVTAIGNNAFQYCGSLDTVEVEWDAPIIVSSGMYTASSIAEATLSVPEGSKNAYETADIWNGFGSIVERVTVANEHVAYEQVKASYTNGMLFVDSPSSEMLKVFSIAGALVYATEKKEGKANYSVNLPNEIYVVTGSSGWNIKVLAKR